MDRRLFQEASLTKNIPKEILDEIDEMDPVTDQRIFDSIFESVDLRIFLQSVNLPVVENTERKSQLLEEAMKTMKLTKKKK